MEKRLKFFKENNFTVTSWEKDPQEPGAVWVTVEKKYSDLNGDLDMLRKVIGDMAQYEAEFNKDVIEDLSFTLKND